MVLVLFGNSYFMFNFEFQNSNNYILESLKTSTSLKRLGLQVLIRFSTEKGRILRHKLSTLGFELQRAAKVRCRRGRGALNS